MSIRKLRIEKKSEAMTLLEKVSGGPLTMAQLLKSLRECEELSQQEFANLLRISRQNLCDLEKGRKFASPVRAAQFAQKLGYPPSYFMHLALQEELRRAGLKIKVNKLDAA